MDGTAKGLIDFFNFAASKGMINKNTAGALRIGTQVVLSTVEPDDWEGMRLADIDVEDFAGRFERLSAGRFKPDSLTTYKSRFRNAVAMYLEYIGNPSGWRFKAERPYRQRKQKAAGARAVAEKGARAQSATHQPQVAQVVRVDGAGSATVIEYPYPLRPGLVIKLGLPVDLTKQEAKRLSMYLEAIAVEQIPRLLAPAGVGINGGMQDD